MKPFKRVQRRALARLRMLSTKSVHHTYIYLIRMFKHVKALDNIQWLICNQSQLNQIIYIFDINV